ncbi:MAG: hypothetical protein IJ725_04720 [Ruminococcus sp.]|nr:hypothetical protein [Ruminococcus sp.]
MNKKLADILFVFGIGLIIVGILAGVILGFVTGGGFKLVPAITIWLLCIVIGTGFVSVSGSVNKVNTQKTDDEESLRLIIEKIKNED